ncbi:MAG: TraC family protein [Bdellovibrionaceae bacterium]|nr:TraC family protein [Pseudobdellovibrionaceae bacterium]
MTDFLPYWHFDKDFMVFSDGSLGAGFKLSSMDISCKSNEEINFFNKNVENFLKSLDESIRLQVFYRLSPDVSGIINTHRKISDLDSPILKDVNLSRISSFEKNMEGKNYFSTDVYLFIRSKPTVLKKQGLFQKTEKFVSVIDEDYKIFKDKFLKNFEKVFSSLSSLGLSPEVLKNEEWFSLIYEFLNLERFQKFGASSFRKEESLFPQSLSEVACQTDLSVSKDGLTLGDYKYKILSMKLVPDGTTYSAMVESLTKLPFHFWLVQNIEPLDQSKERSKLSLKRRIAHSMASGSEKLSDLESETKFSSIEDLLRELTNGTEKLISFDLNIILWDKDHRKLDEKTDKVTTAFRNMNNAEGITETYASFEAFTHSLPGVCGGFRSKTVKTSNLSHLMPLYSSWEGNSKPVCLLPKRDSTLFGLNPFEQSLPAWNGIVFGGTGSGKSFTVTQLMLMFYAQKEKPRIIWIDNGASSKRLVELFGGEFLDLSTESPFSINLFDLPDGEYKPSPEKVKLILAVLEMILKDEGQLSLPKREKAILEENIFRLYDGGKKVPRLSDLRDALRKHPMPEMQKYADILFSWTGDTAYGKILDHESNITFKTDLICIEVQALSNHPDLKNAILLLLTSYIQEMSCRDFARPYLLIVDEAERLFQTEMAKQFVITCYRTWRKFNSGIWSLSQNYKDFLSDKNLRDSLLPNTTSLIVLRQRKIDWDDFQKTFDFNDAQMNSIKSLEIVKRKYSEFYYLQDEKDALLRLSPDPLSYWICTSDPNDKAAIETAKQKYPEKSMLEVLKELAK